MWVGGKAHPAIDQQHELAERLKLKGSNLMSFTFKPNLRQNVKLV
jgi:hypothetical protein